MRWFHVTPKETGNLMSIKNQSSMVNVNVDFSLSGGAAKERVLFPMKLEVTHRRFRSESKFFSYDDCNLFYDIFSLGMSLKTVFEL